MKNTNDKDKTHAARQPGSCKKDVSMFQLFENHPNKETIEEAHETLSKNFVPGRTFADIADIIALNGMKNAFVITLNNKNEIRLSSGFTMIKSGKGICLPKVMFSNFYPGRMEKPILEKLPSEKGGQFGYVTVQLPDLSKLVDCESEEDLKAQLELEETSETTVRNFAILSPKLASSMASTDTEGSRIEMLLRTIQELKDLKLVNSRTTRSKTVMPKPIEDVLKFLSVLAMNEVDSKNKLPDTIEFEKSQQSELKLYLNEVEKLLQRPNDKVETDRERNKDRVVNEEEASEDETNTKKRPRSNSDAHEESSDDDESTKDTSRPCNRDSLSLEQRKDMAILNFIEQVRKGETRESTKSRTKWENWTETSRRTVLALLSKDFEEEPDKIPTRLKEILKLSSASAIVDLFCKVRHDLDCRPDKAMFHQFKLGKISGGSTDITALTGPTIFSCPVQISRGEQGYADARMDLASMGVNTDNLSKEDIRSLTVQKLHIAKDLNELITMVENFAGVWEFLLERKPTPRFVSQILDLPKLMKAGAADIRAMFKDHKQHFIDSFMMSIHKKTTLAIKKASVYGVRGLRNSGGVSFHDIFDSIEEGTFMNRYQVKLQDDANGDNNSNNETQNNNRYRRGNYNNGGFNNQFSPGRNSRGYKTNYNSPSGEDNIENNPNINETKWNQNFGAVMCPETLNDMKEQSIYLPKFNGSQLCLKFHAKGICFKNCQRAATHVKLHGRTKQMYDDFSHAIHDAAEKRGRITINKKGKK